MNMLDQVMIDFLRAYIRINTAMPFPDYGAAHALWNIRASEDGILYQRILLASGYEAGIMTFPGTDPLLPALVLNHHMDVVPALDVQAWSAGPFAAEIRNGRIIGRGTQDIKALGVVHYYALQSLRAAGCSLKRTVHMIIVPDEECGGFKGTKELLDTSEFASLHIGFMLDEAPPSGHEQIILIKVDERKPLQVRITACGMTSHGSRLHCINAIHTLIDALTIITGYHKEQQNKIGCADGELLSLNITSLHAGVMHESHTAINVVPHYATATVDIRVPPHMYIEDARALLETVCHQYPSLSYTIEAIVDEPTPTVSYDSFLHRSISRVLHNHGFMSKTFVSEGASDMRFYRQRGIECLGFAPFTSADNAHGVNESLSIKEVVRARMIMADLISLICSTKEII